MGSVVGANLIDASSGFDAVRHDTRGQMAGGSLLNNGRSIKETKNGLRLKSKQQQKCDLVNRE